MGDKTSLSDQLGMHINCSSRFCLDEDKCPYLLNHATQHFYVGKTNLSTEMTKRSLVTLLDCMTSNLLFTQTIH